MLPNQQFEILNFTWALELICLKNKRLAADHFDIIVKAAKFNTLDEAKRFLTENLSPKWWEQKLASVLIDESKREQIRLYALHRNGLEIPELVAIIMEKI